MVKRLYINVFETSSGVVGHLVGPKQYARMAAKQQHGMTLYAGHELHIVADESIQSKDAVECAKFVAYEWQEQGRPNLVEVREKVLRFARKKVME